MDLRSLGSLDDSFLSSLLIPVSDVVSYRFVEKHGILGDNSDLSSQTELSQVSDVVSVNRYGTLLNVVESV